MKFSLIVEQWRIDVRFVHDRWCLNISNIACLEVLHFTLNFYLLHLHSISDSKLCFVARWLHVYLFSLFAPSVGKISSP